MTDSTRTRLDGQAVHELDLERRRHARAIERLAARDREAIVAEANRHIDRVQEVMRDLARRLSGAPTAFKPGRRP